MNPQTERTCRQLVENKYLVKTVFPMDSSSLHLACAGIYTAKGKSVDVSLLQFCKELLKEKTSAWSFFRGTARSPVVAMMAAGANPAQTLENALAVYQLLKKDFWASTYLPLAAMIIAQTATSRRFGDICSRTRGLYNRMKREHPFLTSSEDSALCALMALSEKSDDELIAESERCYQILKVCFHSRNAVQSLSHVLALMDGDAVEKCRRTIALFDKLRAAGKRYGTQYELPTLGVLAMSGGDLDEIVAEMAEVDKWLSKQKGFGFFSSISRRQRLMYAGILAQRDFLDDKTLEAAAVGGTISMILAMHAATCAAVAASSAASTASSH